MHCEYIFIVCHSRTCQRLGTARRTYYCTADLQRYGSLSLPTDERWERRRSPRAAACARGGTEGPPGAWTRTAALCPARPIGNSGERARACGGTGASPIAAACLPCPCPCPRGSVDADFNSPTYCTCRPCSTPFNNFTTTRCQERAVPWWRAGTSGMRRACGSAVQQP